MKSHTRQVTINSSSYISIHLTVDTSDKFISFRSFALPIPSSHPGTRASFIIFITSACNISVPQIRLLAAGDSSQAARTHCRVVCSN